MQQILMLLVLVLAACSVWADPIGSTNGLEQAVGSILRCVHTEDAQLAYSACKARFGYSDAELADAFAKSIEEMKGDGKRDCDRTVAIYWFSKVAETNQLGFLRDIAVSETNVHGQCAIRLYFNRTAGTDEAIRFANEILDSQTLPETSKFCIWTPILQRLHADKKHLLPDRDELFSFLRERARHPATAKDAEYVLKYLGDTDTQSDKSLQSSPVEP